MIDLKSCDNPQCDHQTTLGSAYCCAACSYAHEGRYEIHESGLLGHAASCLERHAERGPSEPWARAS